MCACACGWERHDEGSDSSSAAAHNEVPEEDEDEVSEKGGDGLTVHERMWEEELFPYPCLHQTRPPLSWRKNMLAQCGRTDNIVHLRVYQLSIGLVHASQNGGSS